MTPACWLSDVLEEQDQVIARRQVLAHLSERALDRRIRDGGPWQVLLPGVYGAFTGTATEQQRRRAALLYAGDGSFITGATGCREYGLRKGPGSPLVTVASTQRKVRSLEFAHVERSTRPVNVRVRNGLAYADPARCVIDAALQMTRLDDVRALVAEAVQRRVLLIEHLVAELRNAPKRGSGFVRRAVREVLAGARSAAECKQIETLSRSKVLPSLHYNCSLMGPEGWIADPDAYCEESGVAQEIDSVEYHMHPEAWKATMARRSTMVARGVRVLEAPPSRLDADPHGIRIEFEQTHLIGLRSGPPPGVWVRCRPDCTVNKRPAA